MTSINNSLQTALQSLYAQLGSNMQSNTQSMKADPNVLHNLGLSADLVANLRQDLNAVTHGSNPDRALNNLLTGLQHLSRSTGASAKEWPADKELPAGTKGMSFVKGEEGRPFVVGEDGEPVYESEDGNSSEVPFGVNKGSNLPLGTAAGHVISDLKTLLDAEAAGNDISSSLANLRSSLKQLLDNPTLTNDPEQVRNALRKSIEAHANQ